MTRGAPSLAGALWLALLILPLCRDVSAMPCHFKTSPEGHMAQCSHRRMTRFPDSWPADVTWLDLSDNFLTSLSGLAHPRLAGLRHLNVCRNLLTSLPDNAFQHVPGLQWLDLSSNNLTSLSRDVFTGLPDLTALVLANTSLHVLPERLLEHAPRLHLLDLSHNLFTDIPSETLRRVPHLRQLSMNSNSVKTLRDNSLQGVTELNVLRMRHNRLSSVQPRAFNGLRNLTLLDLQQNALHLDTDTYPTGVFSPLTSLKTLWLADNDKSNRGEYPPVFGQFHSLENLTIDAFSVMRFGNDFSNLTSLTSLSFVYAKHRCSLKRLTNDSFEAFHNSTLSTLTIQGCPLIEVDKCTFCHLPQLTNLTVRYAHIIPFTDLLLSLYGLRNQTLELLRFAGNQNKLPLVLDGSHTMYLNDVCVRTLDFHSNNIAGFTSTAFARHGKLLACLKRIDLSLNSIRDVQKSAVIRFIVGLKNIESFSWSRQKIHLPDKQQTVRGLSAYKKPRTDMDLFVPIPASMKSWNLSAGIYDVGRLPPRVHFPKAGNLTSLDMSYCRAYDFRSNFTGLSNLLTLDLSGNDCGMMAENFFNNFHSLRRLRMADAHLSQEFLLYGGSRLLEALRDLEELDLGDNLLSRLSEEFFSGQPRLKVLSLAGNRFSTLPLDLSKHQQLAELDLTDNFLSALTPTHTQALDHLASRHPFTLRLRGNPLTCTCQSMDMIHWLSITDVKLDGDVIYDGFDADFIDNNGRDYPCVSEDGELTSTGAVMVQWERHWSRCAGQALFAWSLAVLGVAMMVLLLVYLLSSRWAYIKHAWKVFRHLKLPQRQDFVHDALFVYAADDLETATKVKNNVQRVSPHLRLALTDDVIMPGTVYLEGLARCVKRSWKIVLVVSDNFLQDQWAGFAVAQAQGSITDSLPHRVMLLYVGRLKAGSAPRPTHVSVNQLLQSVEEGGVYHLQSVVPHGRHGVWARLAQAIARA